MPALFMAALFCTVTRYAEADTVRTRVGVGYNGKVMGLDAKGLLIDHAGAVRTIPRDDIVRLEVDQYPDLGKAEVLFDRGVVGAGDAERLYTAALGADPPQWLRAFIAWRLFRLRVGASRYPEALDAYLAVARESPEFAEGLVWPAVSESNTDRQRALLAKVDEALAKPLPEPVARELTRLRSALSPEPQVPPGPSTPDVPGPQSQTPGVSAEAAEKARIAFASLFGDRVAQVEATADLQDDIALAADLLRAAQIAGSQPAFLILVCEKAWEFGNKDPAGHATALDAMGVLADKVPAMAEACRQKMLITMRHQYECATGAARVEAGGRLLEPLMQSAGLQERVGNLGQALAYLREAQDVANAIDSPQRAAITAKVERLSHRQQVLAQIAERVRQSQASPQDRKVREDIFFLYAIELDSPADANTYADGLSDEGMKRCALQATTPLERLPETACLDMGDWYRFLADRASPAAKPNMLAKARDYYRAYLDRHTTDDLARTKAVVACQQVESALEKSKREGPDSGGRGFLGLSPGAASKIVYVVDRSGSMTDSIVFVKYELKCSIRELGPEKQFHVIFYSSGPALEMPARRLVSATDANKQEASKFIDSVIPQGETDPSDALARAFAVKPDLIYLLTDGEFDKAVADQIRRANVGKKVTIHTIGFLYKIGEKTLKQIAEQNNGTYKFVAESDLETLLN